MTTKSDTGLPTIRNQMKAHSPPPTPTPSQPKQVAQPVKPEKVVTTVRVLPTTLAMMHALKSIETSNSGSVKFGDILDEAIEDLFDKKGYDKSILKHFRRED